MSDKEITAEGIFNKYIPYIRNDENSFTNWTMRKEQHLKWFKEDLTAYGKQEVERKLKEIAIGHTVKEIIEAILPMIGCQGLCGEDCGCDDFPCEGLFENCKPAVIEKCDRGNCDKKDINDDVECEGITGGECYREATADNIANYGGKWEMNDKAVCMM